jgi:hypothetical protein
VADVGQRGGHQGISPDPGCAISTLPADRSKVPVDVIKGRSAGVRLAQRIKGDSTIAVNRGATVSTINRMSRNPADCCDLGEFRNVFLKNHRVCVRI